MSMTGVPSTRSTPAKSIPALVKPKIRTRLSPIGLIRRGPRAAKMPTRRCWQARGSVELVQPCQQPGVLEAAQAVEAVAVGGIDLDRSALCAVECRLDGGSFQERIAGADDADDMQRHVQFHPIMLSRASYRPDRPTCPAGGSGRNRNCVSGPPALACSEQRGDRLDLGVVVEDLVAHLASPAGLLVAAEWQRGVEDVVAVDPDGAGPDLLG